MVMVDTGREHSSDDDLDLQLIDTQPASQAYDEDEDDEEGDDSDDNDSAAETSHTAESSEEEQDEEESEAGDETMMSEQDAGELVNKPGGMKTPEEDLFDLDLEQQLVEALTKQQKVKGADPTAGSGDSA